MFKSNGDMKYWDNIIHDAPAIMNHKDLVYHNEFNRDYQVLEKVEYYNVPCSFDIEATNILTNEKLGTMWIWMFGINGWLYYGRTYEELLKFLEYVVILFELNTNKKIIVYTHNLSYDFSFIRKWLDIDKVFSIDSRTPLYATTCHGIEFRDSYILTGYSLEKVALKCKKYPCKKLKGDLDYKVLRHYKTPIIPGSKEWNYCQEDVRILCNYIQEQIEKEKKVFNIPLTKTGYVRRDVFEKTVKKSKNYKNFIHTLNLTAEDYQIIKDSYGGGFTHGGIAKHSIYKNVSHIDFTSSYPFCLLAFKYPCSSPLDCNYTKIEELRQSEGYILTIRFKKLEEIFIWEHYLSTSRCKYYLDCKEITETEAKKHYLIVDNGRIVGVAPKYLDDLWIETTITNIDLEIIKKNYKWKEYKIVKIKRFTMSRLPKELITTILYYYKQKTILKGTGSSDYDYYKEMLNSIYGFISQSPLVETWEYSYKGWNKADADISSIDIYNNNHKRTTFYPWACFCTAYARANLWGANPFNGDDNYGILQIAEDYIYCDTDSIFFLNKDKHEDGINKYNNRVLELLSNLCKEYNITLSDIKPQNQKGEECLIGVWDWEQDIKTYKALRAKAYMCEIEGCKDVKLEDGSYTDLTFTVSGARKQDAIPYMLKKYGSIENCFKEFKEGLSLPCVASGKLTPAYKDDEFELDFTDYLGQTAHIHELSSVHLYEVEYNISIDENNIKLQSDYRHAYESQRDYF